MDIIELKEREDISEDLKLSRTYLQFELLLKELRKKELPQTTGDFVNQNIEDLNATSLAGNELRKSIKQKQTGILNLLEKEHKIVPKNHYQNLWLALGLCVFGLPLGIIFGSCMDNMGMLGIGLPVGMAVGVCLGAWLDKKACKEGKQLDVEIKY